LLQCAALTESASQFQEKPDLHDPPERAPAGIEVELLVGWQHAAEWIRWTLGLLHPLQVTEEISEVGRILSKSLPHISQVNLYTGMRVCVS
jgi:hypothetical protein